MQITHDILSKEEGNILSLEEVKNFLRVAHNYDDTLILNLIQAAIEYAESFIRSFVHYRIIKCTVLKASREIFVKYLPFDQLLSAKMITRSDGEDIKHCIEVCQSNLIITQQYLGKDIELKYKSGYGQKPPQLIKMGILKQVSSMYEFNDGGDEFISEIHNLYAPYRNIKI